MTDTAAGSVTERKRMDPLESAGFARSDPRPSVGGPWRRLEQTGARRSPPDKSLTRVEFPDPGLRGGAVKFAVRHADRVTGNHGTGADERRWAAPEPARRFRHPVRRMAGRLRRTRAAAAHRHQRVA